MYVFMCMCVHMHTAEVLRHSRQALGSAWIRVRKDCGEPLSEGNIQRQNRNSPGKHMSKGLVGGAGYSQDPDTMGGRHIEQGQRELRVSCG